MISIDGSQFDEYLKKDISPEKINHKIQAYMLKYLPKDKFRQDMFSVYSQINSYLLEELEGYL